MADTKLTALTETTDIADTDLLYVTDGGSSRKMTRANFITSANLIDNYEEGTWTPTDQSGAGLTFADADGVYRRIGDMVFVTWAIDYPVTADTNGVIIGGLPFVVDIKNLSGGSQYGGASSLTDKSAWATAQIAATDGTSKFGAYASGTTSLITNASLSGGIVRGSMIYLTT